MIWNYILHLVKFDHAIVAAMAPRFVCKMLIADLAQLDAATSSANWKYMK